jgi:hypothetical protein
LKAELFDHPFDAADTDDPTRLVEFLGDDGGSRLGIEEALADDLTNDFVGAAVIALGAAFLAGQSGGPAFAERLAELEVSLFTEAEVAGGLERTTAMAFAVNEHGEFACHLIVGGDRESASGTDKLVFLGIEL